MTNEELIEARMLGLAAPTLLPLLENKKRVAFERLLGRFQSGETDFLALVAELNTLHTMEREIRIKMEIYTEKQKENGR